MKKNKLQNTIEMAKQFKFDEELSRNKDKYKDVENKYKYALSEIADLKDKYNNLNAFNSKHNYDGRDLKISGSGKKGISTAVLMVGDNHFEETVTSEQTNGLNAHNLTIATNRNDKLWSTAVKLVDIQRGGVTIDNIVVCLLGDSITGHIHEEGIENNQLAPPEAIVFATQRFKDGIDYILKNGKFKSITVVCKIGNHSRITKKRRFSSEAENSLEYIMYHQLAGLYAAEKRISFVIDKAYHTYITVYDTVLRIHHGSDIKYSGGVGGITIPVKKAISQWNKSKHADIDLFGHVHQSLNGKDFCSNGSTIGYNAFALAIKAEYERPSQTLFLIHPKYGKTIYMPIYLD